MKKRILKETALRVTKRIRASKLFDVNQIQTPALFNHYH
jgi:hypothetical protein